MPFNIDLSIVVPTFNRAASLKWCLDSLLKQNYPKEKYEVIVVDDSPDNATKVLLERLKTDHPNLVYLPQCHKGPAAARNRGIREASGEIIGFTDDDCIVHTDWVSLMVNAHKKNPCAAAVGGKTTIPSSCTALMVSERLSNGAIQTTINNRKEIIFFPTCNVSIKKWIFEYYCFNERFHLPGGEDLDFFWRLFKDGHTFLWKKEIGVIHYRDNTLRSFLRQAYAYGRGNFLVQRLHNDQPLLKELKTGAWSFWLGTANNIIKLPKFAYDLSRDVVRENKITKTRHKLSLYVYFMLHKIVYLMGNVFEFFKQVHDTVRFWRTPYPPPHRLIVDTTHSCNLTCRICEIWKTTNQKDDVSASAIKRILFQAHQLGIQEICLTGGEPLLRHDIFEIIEYAQSLRIKPLGIISNGILIDSYIEKLNPYLIDNTISINISLDSLDHTTHNFLRNSHFVWGKAMSVLQKLSSIKKEHPQINFNVTSIILNQNLEELLDLALFIRSLRANSMQFQPLLTNNVAMPEKGNSALWIPTERLAVLDRAIDDLISFKKENQGFIRNSVRNLSLIKKYYRKTITHRDVRCSSGQSTVLITNQGICTTCFSPYGNVKEINLARIMKGRERIIAHKRARRCSSPCLLTCFCDER